MNDLSSCRPHLKQSRSIDSATGGGIGGLSAGVGAKPSSSTSSAEQRTHDDGTDDHRVPQITISDNERDETSGQVTASDDDEYPYGDEETGRMMSAGGPGPSSGKRHRSIITFPSQLIITFDFKNLLFKYPNIFCRSEQHDRRPGDNVGEQISVGRRIYFKTV